VLFGSIAACKQLIIRAATFGQKRAGRHCRSRAKEYDAEFKHPYWGRQVDAIAHELSRLAIICDIELGRDALAERILENDESVCGRQNPKMFNQMRQHLMALFALEEKAIEQLGPEDTKDILDQVRAAIIAIGNAGSVGHSLPKDEL